MTPPIRAGGILLVTAMLLLIGAGCGDSDSFQGPENYVSPTSPPPHFNN